MEHKYLFFKHHFSHWFIDFKSKSYYQMEIKVIFKKNTQFVQIWHTFLYLASRNYEQELK